MKEKPINISWDLKKAEWKARIRQRWQDLKEFYVENPELAGLVTLGVSGAIGVGAKLAKDGIASARRSHAEHLEQRRRDYQVYDNQLGKYLELRRKLDNDDWVRISRRKKEGETLAEILDSMNALK